MSASAAAAEKYGFADVQISDKEFGEIRRFLHAETGIALGENKKALVTARLGKRLRHHGLGSYGEYYALATSAQHLEERQHMVDLLTTNETYFFREPEHFNYLRDEILPNIGARSFRVWSAASSTGEEAYSLAMELAAKLGVVRAWEVIGTDISQRALETARRGHYLPRAYRRARTEGIPPEYLAQYCLKGSGSYEGTLLIERRLRGRVQFLHVNLMRQLPSTIADFDVVFLRNVLIYFEPETKRQVVRRVLGAMKPDAHLMIGHSESVTGLVDGLTPVAPTIYRKGQA